jgi:hypothetical protein
MANSNEITKRDEQRKGPPVGVRIILLCFAWLVVLFAFSLHDGIGIAYFFSHNAYAWLFPLGLFMIPSLQSDWGMLLSMFLGWLIYAVFMGVILMVRRRVGFLIVFSLFCLTLAFNVAGCFAVQIGP